MEVFLLPRFIRLTFFSANSTSCMIWEVRSGSMAIFPKRKPRDCSLPPTITTAPGWYLFGLMRVSGVALSLTPTIMVIQVRYATRPGDFRISVIPYNLRRRITFKHFVVANTDPYRGQFVWLQARTTQWRAARASVSV
jgi:hypothetical protein